MLINVPLSRTHAGRGSLLCESIPIDVVSFYLITSYNSVVVVEGWAKGASTPVFLLRNHL